MSHFLDAEIVGLAGKRGATKISFDRYVNIIYGLNGSGKTSLLKILHSAMKMDPSPLRNVPFTHAEVRVHSIAYEMDFTLRIDKSDVEAPESVEDQLSLIEAESSLPQFYKAHPVSTANWKRTPERPDKSERGFKGTYLPTSRLHMGMGRTTLHSRNAAMPTEDVLDQLFARAVIALWTRYTSDVVREVRDAQENGLANILRGVLAGSDSQTSSPNDLNLERGYESTRNFLERQGSPGVLGTFAQFKRRLTKDRSLQKVVKDISQIEQAIEEALTPQRRLESLIKKCILAIKLCLSTTSPSW